ncbi:hypothetical protein [Halalkalibacter urbisdiaboli]|uniref:hypothetical protein n=1 Tax=Halalkalibacter urbisdiaboli TaxID=1960589 RepID=UPI000B451E40|nr:hypothetical protein [Halalkalibacter urbisdiaboli]
MKITESLHFIHEDKAFLKRQFNITRSYLHNAYDGIREAIKWLKTSAFQTVVKDLSIYITDEPINFPGELALIEGVTFQPIVYINVMSITEDFQNEEYRYDLKKEHVTCFEYAVFVFLHEVGHYVHALIGGRGASRKEKIFDYFDRGEYHYQRFVETMGNGETNQEKKRYRNIPHEKAADRFARQYTANVLQNFHRKEG